MSFLFYFAVLLFTAASAVFGLDLMTAPLPHHAKPQVADTAAPAKPRATDQGNKVAARDDGNAGSRRALSPVYPAAPVAPKPLPQQQSRQDSAAPSATSPAPAETTGTTSVDAAPAPEAGTPAADGQPTVQPAVQQTSSQCNVQACSSAYHSFNASDCTYQPYEGPRRLCVKGQASQRAALQPRQEQRHRRFGGRARADDPGLRGGGRRMRATRNWYDDYDEAPPFTGRRRGLFGFPIGSNDYWR